MLDIDGFRMDKGQQITVDAQGEFADHIRQCASKLGKDNFFIPGKQRISKEMLYHGIPDVDTQTGEIVSGNAFGAVYLGRGKEPSMRIEDTDMVVRMIADTSNGSVFIRGEGKQAFGKSVLRIRFDRVRLTTRSTIDAACFHYSVRDPKYPVTAFHTAFRVIEHYLASHSILQLKFCSIKRNADFNFTDRHTVQ